MKSLYDYIDLAKPFDKKPSAEAAPKPMHEQTKIGIEIASRTASQRGQRLQENSVPATPLKPYIY